MVQAIFLPQGKVCMPPTYGIVGLTQSPNAVLFIFNETDLTVLIQSFKKNHSTCYGSRRVSKKSSTLFAILLSWATGMVDILPGESGEAQEGYLAWLRIFLPPSKCDDYETRSS